MEVYAVPRIEGAGGVAELRLVSTETTMQLVNTGAEWKAKNIFPLVSAADFDADELGRHVKELGDCKQVLSDSKNKRAAEESVKSKTVNSGGPSSVLGAATYKTNVVVVSETQVAVSLSQGVFSACTVF